MSRRHPTPDAKGGDGDVSAAAATRGGSWGGALLAVARGATALALAAGVVALSRYPFDDAYIHMRIARNLAFAGQPYFNLGERVMGDSSPVWLLLIASLFKLFGRADRQLVVGAACVVVAALVYATEGFLAVAGRRRGVATWLASTAIVFGLALASGGMLMESALAALLAVSGVHALSRGRAALAGALLALAGGTRIEMLLLGAIVLAFGARGRERLRFLAGYAPPLTAGAALLWSMYGSLLPNTARAKSIVYDLSFSEFFGAVPSFGSPALSLVAWVVGSLLAAGALALFARASLGARRGDREALCLGLFAAALMTAYAARRTLIFEWYWPNVTYPAVVAVTFAALRAARRWPEGPRPRAAVALAALATSLVGFASLPFIDDAAEDIAVATLGSARESALTPNLRTFTYARIGEALDATCPDGVVMAPEIGALGWAFRGKILDAEGLISPEVLPFHPLRVPEERSGGDVGAIPGRAVAAFQPDLVVTMEIFAHDFLRKRDAEPILAGYQPRTILPVWDTSLGPAFTADLWESRFVLVLARPSACPGGHLERAEQAVRDATPFATMARRDLAPEAPGRTAAARLQQARATRPAPARP